MVPLFVLLVRIVYWRTLLRLPYPFVYYMLLICAALCNASFFTHQRLHVSNGSVNFAAAIRSADSRHVISLPAAASFPLNAAPRRTAQRLKSTLHVGNNEKLETNGRMHSFGSEMSLCNTHTAFPQLTNAALLSDSKSFSTAPAKRSAALPITHLVKAVGDRNVQQAAYNKSNIVSKPSDRLERPANVFDVQEASHKDHSIIAMNPLAMKQLGIFKGDTVLIKGRKRRETCAIALPDAKVLPQNAAIPASIRSNLRLGVGYTLRVYPFPSIKIAKSVFILPFEDTLSKLPKNVNILRDVLTPYFHANYLPVHAGDHFKIQYKGSTVEFKILQIAAPNKDDADFGVVGSETVIDCSGEALSRDEDESVDEIGYDDIGGLVPQLIQIRETIDLPLRHPEIFDSIGIPTPKGVLLHGAPGCGKTMIARSIAAETGAYFFVINGPEIMSKLAGESEQNLRKIFEKAVENAPSIIFIDEIDSIAAKRDKAGGEVERRVVSQLLTLLDGLKPSQNVIVIAATNRPNVLDPALRRFGRFDRELEISIPDEEGRLDILRKKTSKMRLAADVNLSHIAKDSHGFVGADLAQLCFEAAMQCIRKHLGEVDFDADSIPPEVLSKFEVDNAHFQHALGVCNPSALRERHVEVPHVSWRDIGGLEEVKRELVETVQYPVEYPEKFKKYGMAASKGVLFYGPPGCGKTLLAKAVANECNANFISVKGPELLTMWFGESEANVRELFDKARAAAPCILFFDEIDSIAKSRGSGAGGGGEAADRVINQILTEIDGMAERKPIFIIGASNRPDILDPAITRPGRLDHLLYIPLPDMKSRINIFKAALRKSPLEPGLDIQRMAEATSGFSGADITEICQRAAKQAIRESIIAEAKRGRPLREGEKDPVPFMTKKHFETALKHARRSVTDEDIKRYEAFSTKMKLLSNASEQPLRNATKVKDTDDSGRDLYSNS